MSFSLLMFHSSAQAQMIPAADGTGTVVTPVLPAGGTVGPTRFDITGGQMSRDRANLFHSFQQFGLSEGQIANFVSNPGIQNILARIVGGQYSLINGTIQVLGGNSNLFLINPAGIVFGPQASVNVPGSFTAVTATGIEFGDRWFSAIAPNDYAALVGTPSGFYFGNAQPGSIVNAGQLQAGQNLTLLAGTVLSSGTLVASGGQVTIATVPGDRFVRLSSAGQLLNLEIGAKESLSNLRPQLPTPLALPELLTGSGMSNAAGVVVNQDGTVQLIGSGLEVKAGDVALSHLNTYTHNNPNVHLQAQEAGLFAAHHLTLAGSQLDTAGNLTLQAADTVRVRDSVTHPFLARAGGNLSIQGDRSIDILALNPVPGGNAPFQSAGNLTLISNGTISGDSHFAAGGSFSIRNLSGGPGNFFSEFDPIISSDGNVSFGDYTGASLKVEAKGSIVGGDITITGPDTTLTGTDPDLPTLTSESAVILRAGVTNLAHAPNVPLQPSNSQTLFSPATNLPSNSITVGSISANGSVVLSAPGNITSSAIDAGKIAIASSSGAIIAVDSLQASDTIALTAAHNILTTDLVTTGSNSGNISLSSRGGDIQTGAIAATGEIRLDAAGNLTIQNLTGETLKATSTGTLTAEKVEVSGTVSLETGGNLKMEDAKGIDLSITSRNGGITANQIEATGNLTLKAATQLSLGDITASTLEVTSQQNAIASGNIRVTGNATFTAADNLLTGNLQTAGLTATSRNGTVALRGVTASGTVTLQAAGNLTVGQIEAKNLSASSSKGEVNLEKLSATGPIALQAAGDLNIGNLTATSLEAVSNTGSVSTGTLNTQGNVTITAGQQITLGKVSATANNPAVTLQADNDITVESINAAGGTVVIATPRFFRATGTFTNPNGIATSLSTVGEAGGGPITIRHGGGNTNPVTPFVVGDATTNGTAGAIASSASNVIRPRQSFPASYTQGDISIVTAGQATPTPTPTPTPRPTPTPAPRPTPTPAPRPTLTPTPRPTLTPTPTPTPTVIQSPPAIETETPVVTPASSEIPRPTPTPVVVVPSPLLSPPPLLNPAPPVPTLEEQTRLLRDLQGQSDAVRPLPSENAGLRTIANPTLYEPVLQSTFRTTISNSLDSGNLQQAISLLDKSFTQEFREYFNQTFSLTAPSVEEIQKTLKIIEERTGTKPSLIYVFSRDEQLDLALITASGPVVHESITDAKREVLLKVVNQFREDITSPRNRNTTTYLQPAQQLYRWMIAPLEATLKARGIDTIAFTMDRGLRSLPIAALHDGQQFLVEKYNLGLIPSLNLTDTRYADVRRATVLAMGASEFRDASPLPAVPIEIQTITREWGGAGFLNQSFTLSNLKQQRQAKPFGIIHLATHGEFKAGTPSDSFIELWDQKLRLNQLRQLQWNEPQVELLVLSACKTAVGDEQAELGFGGLAVQAGVKTALASLWYVSDEGTLALMAEFYHALKTVPIKSAALRQAQIAMLRGQVRLQDGQLRGTPVGAIQLPPSLRREGESVLSHPYYWAAFVMIGSPW
ncbi:MAG: CHAT domain-containing protein [Actinomycetota bacterium]